MLFFNKVINKKKMLFSGRQASRICIYHNGAEVLNQRVAHTLPLYDLCVHYITELCVNNQNVLRRLSEEKMLVE